MINIKPIEFPRPIESYGFKGETASFIRAFVQGINERFIVLDQPSTLPTFTSSDMAKYLAMYLDANKDRLVELRIPRPQDEFWDFLGAFYSGEYDSLKNSTFYGEEAKNLVKYENNSYRYWFKQIRNWIFHHGHTHG